MTLTISAEQDGRAVLDILVKQLGISRSTVKHLKFKENGILLNGAHVTVRQTLHTGDVLTLAIEDAQAPEKLTPSDLPLDVAYEDEYTVVPNKPPSMPTHQSHGHYGDTVANALAYRYAEQGLPFVFRPVNRLDRNTSGLLIIARDRLSAAYLSEAMRRHKIEKRYVAILDGTLANDCGTIDTYMRRTAESIIVRENCAQGEGGDRAVTEYRVLCKSRSHTLVCAIPRTGRTHQLRVHFAGLGAPIVGDDIYGTPSKLIPRHALHSFYVSFPNAKSGDTVTVSAPLPKDMLTLAQALFGDALDSIDQDVRQLILPKKGG